MDRKSQKVSDYSLSERIKFLRENRNFTQAQLAESAKISQATVAHIEKGTKDPSVETLSKIADALDTHIATLFASHDVFVFDMRRLRRKYTDAEKLTPHLYAALARVVQYARDIGLIK